MTQNRSWSLSNKDNQYLYDTVKPRVIIIYYVYIFTIYGTFPISHENFTYKLPKLVKMP